jgi:glyoxylase-like metal-dependent hydrolase (beta-lactamase superfamily II)
VSADDGLAASGIHRLAIPTPFAVGRVNLYLIDDDPLTLVDVGPNSGKSLDALERALAEHGRRVEDLQRLVLTHQHMDHTGLAGIVARRSGAEIAALDRMAPVLEEFGAWMERDDELAEAIMRRHGIPPDVVTVLRAVSRAYRGWGGGADLSHPLPDGGRLDFAGRSWEVLHRPGHSPSDTLFFDAERGQLVGGDHLLGHISSNPLISRPLGGRSGDPAAGRPRALVNYIRSLEETRTLPAEVVLPGHGDLVTRHAALIAERLGLHERRAEKIRGLIAEQPRTAHELAQAIWGNVAVTQAFLTLSEVLGHVDLLLDRGQVAEEERGGVVRFAPAG